MPHIGFETKIHVKSYGSYFQVNALDSCGKIIGKSRIVYVKQEYDED